MAINFTDSPANGATQVIGGRTYTYNSAKNKWDTTATEVTGPTAAVYATVDNLPGTATTGDQAFVSGTNRLYIWNGSGWYNIALINNSPTWTAQPSSSYSLANDGTATTITIVAVDPEGLPIAYSIVSDTSGNTATVVQGTGISANSFTITPSTSTADAGTFSLTFRASDGINIASAVSEFTLQFKVQNQQYTTALITSVGANNAVNNSFVDSSTNSHTLTAAGNATQNTFSPYRHGGYSTYFDGAGDYLKVADSAEHEFGTGDFSIEFWWWPETLTGGTGSLHIAISAPNDSHNQLVYHESTYWYYAAGAGGTVRVSSSGNGPATAKAWNHVVLCRTGTTLSIFHNGTRTGSVTSSYSADFSNTSIGRYDSGGYDIDGYIRDMRWLKGSSAYDATQTSITVPTEPLTAITNTKLLTCHLPYIADGSTTGHSITVYGNTKTEPFALYDAQEYSASSHGGSVYFDGTGDYLSIADHADLDMGTSDFTIEGWAYLRAGGGLQTFAAKGTGANSQASYHIAFNGTNWVYYLSDNGSTWSIASGVSMGAGALNSWQHLALVRNGSTFTPYVNGVAGTTTNSAAALYDSNKIFSIGADDPGNSRITGSISDLRVVKGTAVYTAAFTPPTAPLTAVTNTKLLVQSTDAGIIDKAQSVKTITLNADVKSSTTQSKYLSSSMYFDGTGDAIKADWYGTGLGGFSGNFTVEAWVYPAAPGTANNPVIFHQAVDITQYSPLTIQQQSGSYNYILYSSSTGSSWNLASSSAIGSGSANTWGHIAVVRDGTNIKAYFDGTLVTTIAVGTTALMNATSTYFWIGGANYTNTYFNGYISDVRVTKGLARYTANFTPPAAALQG